jgi:Ankyrin repeats (3 copies)
MTETMDDRILLEKGAELDSKDRRGQTPLSWAAENGHEAVVNLLLEKGAEPDSKDTIYGRTPLSWAAKTGREAVVKLLLEKGAELDSKDIGDRTSPSWAAVKLQLEKGAEQEPRERAQGGGEAADFYCLDNGKCGWRKALARCLRGYHFQRTNYSFLGLILLIEYHPNGKTTISRQCLQNIVLREKAASRLLFAVLYLELNWILTGILALIEDYRQ